MNVCPSCGRRWGPSIERCPVDGRSLRRQSGALAAATGQLAVAHAVADPERLLPGEMVGEYEIQQPIGVGGMGTVYGAKHPVIGKRVAIKVLSAKSSADIAAVERFVQEAQAVNQIGHANIVDIFSFGSLPDGRCYFAMEWLQGETLADRIDRGPMDIPDVLDVLDKLARALEAAHRAGVIHRDLKPENVYLVEDGDAVRVKLLDFGIAKLSRWWFWSAVGSAALVAGGTAYYVSGRTNVVAPSGSLGGLDRR